MEDMEDPQLSLYKSEPIFPVADVVATVHYYQDVLGFAEHWLWGEPPQIGGVRWGRIGVMFGERFGFCGPESGDYAMTMLLDCPRSRAT
jgi:hypothetical protein